MIGSDNIIISSLNPALSGNTLTWNAQGILVAGGNYTLLSTTESISGNLQQQIDGIDTSFTYNVDGTLAAKTTSLGTQSFYYDIDENLVAISGSGQYTNKSFTYDVDGNLTNIEVI